MACMIAHSGPLLAFFIMEYVYDVYARYSYDNVQVAPLFG